MGSERSIETYLAESPSCTRGGGRICVIRLFSTVEKGVEFPQENGAGYEVASHLYRDPLRPLFLGKRGRH